MSGQTMVFGTTMRRSEKWRVYRIRTANSTYQLEVETGGTRQSRRCAVLTCVAPESRAGETFEDSSPQAGEQSLYALSPMDWIGTCLTVGTARTSQIQSVDFVAATEAGSATLPRARPTQTGLLAAQPTPEQPSEAAQRREAERPAWASFPLGYVEMTEAAASLLKATCHRHDLRAALQHEPLLRRRIEHALAECRLMLEALDGRG